MRFIYDLGKEGERKGRKKGKKKKVVCLEEKKV